MKPESFPYNSQMHSQAQSLIRLALEEDLDKLGDVTSDAIFSDEEAVFSLVAKDEGVFCGKELVFDVFRAVDPEVSVAVFIEDAQKLTPGILVAEVRGAAASILKAERTAINFIGFLSGIATAAADLVSGSGRITVLDTRKTLPGYRLLSKYAVLCGGAGNHRIGLFDMVMIKDNHIDAAGSITEAVAKVRECWGNRFAIEVETRNRAEILEALECNVERIMLDNMNDEEMAEAVKLINQRCETEASGNMSRDRLPGASAAGVDFVSFGSLTHSVKTFDFSLKQLKPETDAIEV